MPDVDLIPKARNVIIPARRVIQLQEMIPVGIFYMNFEQVQLQELIGLESQCKDFENNHISCYVPSDQKT